MFTDQGGDTVNVQGLDCHLPPVGYIRHWQTGKMVNIGVYSSDRIISKRKWQIDPRFALYKKWKQEEDENKKKNPGFVHKDLQDFIADCWKWRMGGFWFYIKDEPTYITGKYWFYLSIFYHVQGLPLYRQVDRLFFYFWDYIQADPLCFGAVLLAGRRAGKTSIAGSLALEEATRRIRFNAGIQSKTDDDAAEVFLKAIVTPYRQFPYFFKPASDNFLVNGKAPAKELKFTGKGEVEEELGSRIDFRASNETSYDGYQLGFYIADEVGKPQKVNVRSRLGIVLPCLRDHTYTKVGNTLHTTTVEDMDGSGAVFKKLWEDSDQYNKVNDRTKTKLYRYFISAADLRSLDEYGNPNREAAIQDILADRAAVGTDSRELANTIRKDPITEKEAFQTDSNNCAFDPMILNKRNEELTWGTRQYEKGNLYWVDNEQDGDVYFLPSENGRFMIAHHPSEEEKNAFYIKNGLIHPSNNHKYCGGVDPYDHKLRENAAGSKDLSKGAIVIVKKEDPTDPSRMDNNPVCLYLSRPNDPEVFYEDVIKCLRYYGCEALIENNKPGCSLYMEKRGLENFDARLPKQEKRGIYANATTNAFIAELTDQFISGTNCENVPFIQLIEDWQGFDPTDTTAFDAAMAHGYARMLIARRKQKAKRQNTVTDIKKLFGWYR